MLSISSNVMIQQGRLDFLWLRNNAFWRSRYAADLFGPRYCFTTLWLLNCCWLTLTFQWLGITARQRAHILIGALPIRSKSQDEWDHWGGGSAKSATIDLTIVLQKPLCLPTIELIALQDLNLMLHDLQDSITPFQMSCSWPLMLILVFQKLKGRPNFSIYIKISTSRFAYI